MKTILIFIVLILFLIVLKCSAQDSTRHKPDSMMLIPIRWGWQLENSRQKAIALEQQVKDDGMIINKFWDLVVKYDSVNRWGHQTVATQDSTIKAKNRIIDDKDVIIKNKKSVVKWWWIPLAIFSGWLIGKG